MYRRLSPAARPLSVLLLLAAAVLAAGYGRRLGDRLRYPDEREYVAIAANLRSGNGYSLDGEHPTAYRAPAFPAIVALGLGGGIPGARALNLAAYLFCLAGAIRLARRFAPPPAGPAAALAALGYPVLLYTAGTLYPQTLAAALLLGVLLLYFAPDGRAPSRRRLAACGLLTGLLILTVPSFVFFALFLAAWTWRHAPSGRTTRTALLLAVMLLALLPWQLRNAARFGEFVFVSTNGGINLLLGNAPETTPNAGVNLDLGAVDVAGLDEIERDAAYRAAAVANIRHDPGWALQLYAKKFLNHFNARNRLRTQAESSPARDVAMVVTYGGLCGLVLLRLALACGGRVPLAGFERFVLLLYVLNGAFAAIFFTRIRFRVPFDWTLVCVAGISLAQALRAIAGREAAAGTGTGSTGS